MSTHTEKLFLIAYKKTAIFVIETAVLFIIFICTVVRSSPVQTGGKSTVYFPLWFFGKMLKNRIKMRSKQMQSVMTGPIGDSDCTSLMLGAASLAFGSL